MIPTFIHHLNCLPSGPLFPTPGVPAEAGVGVMRRWRQVPGDGVVEAGATDGAVEAGATCTGAADGAVVDGNAPAAADGEDGAVVDGAA